MFRGGPGGNCICASASIFSEKVVSGKPLLALTSTGLQWCPLVLAFCQLKQPSKPGVLEPEQRKAIFSAFLSTQNSSFAKALGDWEVGEDGKSVVVGKLPESARPALLPPPPLVQLCG